MTLKQAHTPVRTLACDHPGCDGTFAGERNDWVAEVRGRARAHGWLCHNPGPGRPASDLCPRHRGGDS